MEKLICPRHSDILIPGANLNRNLKQRLDYKNNLQTISCSYIKPVAIQSQCLGPANEVEGVNCLKPWVIGNLTDRKHWENECSFSQHLFGEKFSSYFIFSCFVKVNRLIFSDMYYTASEKMTENYQPMCNFYFLFIFLIFYFF